MARYTMRCSACDGVQHDPKANLYRCPKCGQDLYASMPAHLAPALDSGQEKLPVYSDLYMDGVKATDGTDIGSRAKRRAWMKQNNLADTSDFKNFWANAEKERASMQNGSYGRKHRREQIERALYKQLKP